MNAFLQGVGAFLRAVIPASVGLNPVVATALGAMFFICTVAGLYEGLTTAYDKHVAISDRMSDEITGATPRQNIYSLGNAPVPGAAPAYSTAPLSGNVNANFNTKPGPFKLIAVEVTKSYPNGRQVKETYSGSQSNFTIDINEPNYNSQSTLNVTVPDTVHDDDTPIDLKVQAQGNWDLKNGPSHSTNMNLGAGILHYGDQRAVNGDGSRALGPGSEQLSVSGGATTTFGREAYVHKFKVDGVVEHRKVSARLYTAVVQSSGGIQVDFIYRDEN